MTTKQPEATDKEPRTAGAIRARMLRREREAALLLEERGWFVAPPAEAVGHGQLEGRWTVSAETVREAVGETEGA